MKKKICFVVQRYGKEVNGGAELQCQQFAEHMSEQYQVEVLTSKAIDYITWKNEYPSDLEVLEGVTVRRFQVEKQRDVKKFDKVNLKFLGGGFKNTEDETEWVEKQGPYMPSMLEYIRNNKEEYDAFVFFTYLYYPTVMGLELVSEKAILVPEAHDEPFLRMEIIRNLFCIPKAIFYNTVEEKALINDKFKNGFIRSELGGVGIDVPETVSAQDFKEKYHLDDYIIYVGRIDDGKKCNELFDNFLTYKKTNKNNLKLVLLGKPVIKIPKNEDIVSLGFVSNQDKFNGIKGARALVLPSKFESLSIVVLEAMALEVPVIVNGECDVLRGHCRKSNGGLYYYNYSEFRGMLNYILNNPEEAAIMGKNGKEYVDRNYRWNIVMNKLGSLIEYVKGDSNGKR